MAVKATTNQKGRVRTGRIGGQRGGTPGVLVGFIFASPILMASIGLAGSIASSANLKSSFPFQGNIPGGATIVGNATASGVSPAFSADFTSITSLPSQISFSRASNAMMYDSTGKLTCAPNNLIPHSQDFSANYVLNNVTLTGGVADPFGGTTAATITATAVNGNIFDDASISRPTANGITSVYIRRRTGTGTVYLADPSYNNQDITSQVTSSWTRVGLNAPITGGRFLIQLAVSGDAVDICAGQLEAVTYETSPRAYNPTTSSAYYGPRLDHDPVTLAGKGLLIEEQRTNLLLWSNDFSSNTKWTVNNTTIGSSTDILGGSTGALITAAASSAIHIIAPSAAPTSVNGSTYTARVFAKQGTATHLLVGYNSGSDWGWATLRWSDLSCSTNGTKSASAKVTAIGGGVYAFDVTYVSQSGSAELLWVGMFNAQASTIGNASATWTAAGTETVYVLGMQYEAGSFATSYIPTTSAAVTRSADAASVTGTNFSSWYNVSAGTFVVEVDTAKPPSSTCGPFVVSDGSPANRMGVAAETSFVNVEPFAIAGGVVQADLVQINVVNGTDPFRSAFAYQASGFKAANNGGAVQSAGAGTVPTANRLDLGFFFPGSPDSNYLDGHVRKFAYYNTALSDTDLQTKSVVGASF